MTAAERMARHRARAQAQTAATAPEALPPPKLKRAPPRPHRWARAVDELVSLQAEYQAWLDALPESLQGTSLGEKLQAITELDLSELESIEPPKGFGRD
jgi:hypothetical protein